MKFTINGKEYRAAKFNYNTACELEEYGVKVENLNKKPKNALRAYFAISSGMDIDDAGEEIERHILNGGSMQELSVALLTELDKSAFFGKIVEKAREKMEAEDEEEKTEDKKKK